MVSGLKCIGESVARGLSGASRRGTGGTTSEGLGVGLGLGLLYTSVPLAVRARGSGAPPEGEGDKADVVGKEEDCAVETVILRWGRGGSGLSVRN